jgi:copper transport protein
MRILRGARVVVALVLALVVVLVGAPLVGAHAVLVGSDPQADAVLEQPPSQVVLRFNEGVEAGSNAVTLLDPSGDEVPDVRTVVGDSSVTAELPELDRTGSYTVSWSVVSSDGHPVRGAYLFHIRERTLDEPAEAAVASTPPAATALRAGGAVLAVGGLVWVLACWFLGRRDRIRWVPVLVGSLAAMVGSVLAVDAAWSESWSIMVDTTSGRMSLVAVGVALVGLVVSLRPRGGAEELAVAAAATVAVAAQGHAVSLPPIGLSAGATIAHVGAAVAWGTALVWLHGWSRSASPARVGGVVRRLSPWGIAAVVVLAGSGVALVVARVGLDELTTSGYGRLSIVKSVLLVVAVVLAARNRWRLAPALGSEDTDASALATTRFRASLRAEVVVLALALVAGAALAQVRPPDDSTTGGSGGAFSERVAFGDGEVELTVEPGERGTNEVHVTALGADGRLMPEAKDLTLSLTLDDEGVGPLEPEMIPITTGHSMSYAEFPLAGDWTVDVVARPSQFEELRASFTVPIGADAPS